MRAGRNPRFELPHDVVGEEADGPAEETRQSGQFRSTESLHLAAQLLERVVDRAHLDRAARTYQLDPPAARRYHHRGFRAQERVASPLFSAAYAFEKEGVVASRDLEKGRDGGLEIGGDFPRNGDQVEPLACQRFEFAFSRREHRHVNLPGRSRIL